MRDARLDNTERAFPIPPTPQYNNYWHLHGDFVISSDWHIPYHNSDMADKLVKIAKKFKVKNHIIAGDFSDQNIVRKMLYGQHVTGLEVREDLEQTFCIMAEAINTLLDWFDKIYLLTGNHDIYLLKVLQGNMKLDRFWKMIGVSPKEFNKRFFVSAHPFCAVNDTWHITHPATYSRIPMTVARSISTKYRKSVMSAHGHQFGLSTDISGRDICIDTGGLFDYTRMGYKWHSDTTHPQWVGGFVMLKNNKPYLFSELTTDWGFWKKVRV
jgi:UDP-2,3-diacylglucosamine pyrophosphatase LpxH